MAAIKLTAFSGEQPRIIPRLMPPTSAKRAVGVRLDDGALTPYSKPVLVHTFSFGEEDPFAIGTIYRYGDEWLKFEGIVHFARGPVAEERLYYTGDGVPKLRVAGTIYPLAVPFPAAALTATIGGAGAGDIQSRAYVFTNVTGFGEESEPSALSNRVDWQPGQSVTLSGFGAVPSGRNITKQRIYRTQTGRAGTDLYFIAERDAVAADYVDTVPVEQFAEPIPSRAWNAPPDDLSGLTSLPNGMMAAFVGKKLYFSEPFRPHAWPEIYSQSMDYDIVALAAAGPSVWVLTTGQPYFVTGTTPLGMVGEKVEANLPCINARGVVDLGYAVAFPTHDGLAMARGGMVDIVSRNIFSPEQWQRLTPAGMRAGQLSGRWIASYDGTDANGDPDSGTLIIDLSGQQSFLIRSAVKARVWHYIVESGLLYFLDDADGLSVLEFDNPAGGAETLYWRSKEFVLPKPENFGCILIEGDLGATPEEISARAAESVAALAFNAALIAAGSIGGDIAATPIATVHIAGDLLQSIPQALGANASVGVYADGQQVASIGAGSFGKVARLPSGFTARVWEIDVLSELTIEQITMARTVDELKQAA